MRTKLVAGNWKMHGNFAANLTLLSRIKEAAAGRETAPKSVKTSRGGMLISSKSAGSKVVSIYFLYI